MKAGGINHVKVRENARVSRQSGGSGDDGPWGEVAGGEELKELGVTVLCSC